jgi:sarcosine oxidase
MRRDFEYIVVGLGGWGSAAAYWLSRRAGADVLGLEQFELGHVRGESQDHSRIIRLSYHTPDYVELAKHAYAAWHEVERDSGDQLVLRTGGLDFAPLKSAIPLTNYSGSMDAAGVAYEHLDAAEIRRRWPQFTVTDDIHGLYQSESGIAMAARGNAAHVRMAREHGATLKDGAPVERLRSVGNEVEVTAGGVAYRGRRLVIAAGAWSNGALTHFGIHLPLRVTKEQVTYFAAPDPAAFAPDRFPVWIWMDEPSFYGFPTYGEAGPKAAQDCGGEATTPETRTFERDEAAFTRVTDFLATYLPGALGPPIYTKTCLYTLTPDRDFVVDRLPEAPGVVVGLGAGHGFKYASVLGRILAELAVDGTTPSAGELTDFAIDRPILLEASPTTSWMV